MTLPEDRVYARHRRRRGAVLIVGTGAVGGFIAVELARLGVSPMWLVDKDHLDVPNLVRHPLGAGDVGHSKAIALAAQIQRDFPLCDATGIFEDFLDLSADEQRRLVSQVNLVVAATDEMDCQLRINEVCLAARVPAVYPGVWPVARDVQEAEVGEILWVHPGRQTPCYLCANIFRGRGRDARAGGGRRVDIQVLVMATVSVVDGLLDPQGDRAGILNDERTLMLVHAFMPTSVAVQHLFSTRESLRAVRVPFPNTPCPACGGQLGQPYPVQVPPRPATPTTLPRPAPQPPQPPATTIQSYQSSFADRLDALFYDPAVRVLALIVAVVGGVSLLVILGHAIFSSDPKASSSRGYVPSASNPAPAPAAVPGLVVSSDPTAPPAADPGQSPVPAGAMILGGVDLERYCQDGWGLRAVVRYPNAWGWRCSYDAQVAGNGQQAGDQNISVTDACTHQYGDGALSYYYVYTDPNSWFCYR